MYLFLYRLIYILKVWNFDSYANGLSFPPDLSNPLTIALSGKHVLWMFLISAHIFKTRL
jgi:hypothetical protein